MLYPDFVVALTDLPLEELRARGITALAFDLDHTLAHQKSRVISQAYIDYLAGLSQSGFTILLASNHRGDLSAPAASIGAIYVPVTLTSFKPMRRYFRRVAAAAGRPPHQVAMIGDRIVNDIIGANRAGLVTIMVEPLGRSRSWIHRLYERAIEQRKA